MLEPDADAEWYLGRVDVLYTLLGAPLTIEPTELIGPSIMMLTNGSHDLDNSTVHDLMLLVKRI